MVTLIRPLTVVEFDQDNRPVRRDMTATEVAASQGISTASAIALMALNTIAPSEWDSRPGFATAQQ